MSLEWVDSFDHYGGTHTGNNPANARYQNMTSGASSSFSIQSGRFSGSRAINYQGASGVFEIVAGTLAARSTWTVCCALFNEQLPSAANQIFYRLRTGTSVQFTLGISPTGQIVVGRTDITGGNIIATSVSTPYAGANVWRFIELELVIDNTVGEVRVWVDGGSVINLTGQDTQGQAGSTANGIQFWGVGSSGIGNMRMDDLLIFTTATEHTGDMRIETLVPNADTADKDWARSAGSDNYALVDETQTDADTTYVSSLTVGDLDKYDLAALSSTPASILAVQTVMVARKDDAVTREVRSLIDSGGSVANGTTRALGTSYATYYDLNVLDPQGGGAWTAARVNALKVGIETITA